MWSLLIWPLITLLIVGLMIVLAIAVAMAMAGQDFADQPHHLPCPDCGTRFG